MRTGRSEDTAPPPAPSSASPGSASDNFGEQSRRTEMGKSAYGITTTADYSALLRRLRMCLYSINK